ncbi:adenylate/guanylate cyclase domain-containing protein [Bradyrhizobium sp. C-145]|uniref:adenylate/guanylate cyclase domain-containing protein n=1 Tax=Bradyrhizobium sp. C-145 TaxID=574727 RepID=UPI00201B64EE|nr:adenylate/guanylate cyclase domain-containing protein [Bradyrhizobium sp. C-145]UQR62350.1 adenylate/guanylate cyclase domain-containing protein [Bradyrhizobium sp. C-145]
MVEQPVERRLAAILAADVAGYSRLIGADEEGTIARLRMLRQDVIDPAISIHHGHIVKTTGDGMLVEFASVVDAVRCALELQRQTSDRNTGVAADKQISFRIGINLGDVVVESDGDLMGDGVNVAARLENIAPSGSVCLSRAAYDQVKGKIAVAVHDRGRQRLKNIAEPVQVFMIDSTGTPLPSLARSGIRSTTVAAAAILALAAVGGGGAWYLLSGTGVTSRVTQTPQNVAPSRTASRLSIVVLPFSNLSGDPGQDYFADAVTDGLTTDLSRIQGSFVIARNTAFTYKGRPIDVRQIGSELGVRYALEGSVQRVGDQVRINAQLIDTETGGHVWSDRFDRPRSNYLELQDDITGRIARMLGLELVVLAGRSIELEHQTNPTASDLALQGWAALYKPAAPETREEARRLFERAIELDPHTLRAVTGLSLTLANLVINGQSSNPDGDLRRAYELSERAVRLDPNNAAAHAQRARILQAQRRQREAAEEYRVSLQINSNVPTTTLFLGETLVFTGKSLDAIPLFERAIELSPRDPGLGTWQFEMGRAMILLRRDDEALTWLSRSVATNPRLAYAQLYYAAIQAIKGDLSAARAALETAGRLNPNYTSLAKFKTTDLSDDPTYVEQRAYVEEALRKAGLPEQ